MPDPPGQRPASGSWPMAATVALNGASIRLTGGGGDTFIACGGKRHGGSSESSTACSGRDKITSDLSQLGEEGGLRFIFTSVIRQMILASPGFGQYAQQ